MNQLDIAGNYLSGLQGPQNALAQPQERTPQYNALAAFGEPTRAAAEAVNALQPSGAVNGDFIRYANQNATRNLPLSDKMKAALAFLPDLGIEVEVFSGGQPEIGSGKPRVGSTRHDHGHAADVFFHKDGRRLSWQNLQDIPILQEIVRRGRAAGLTGFGAGEGYMQPGSMHIGFGAPAVWGAGGKGENAPAWLREAYFS